jgi:Phage P22-like portal protein
MSQENQEITDQIEVESVETVEETDELAQSEIDKKILDLARKRFQIAEDSETEIRALALNDLEFSAGKQWPDQIKADRDSDGRPSLTINKLPQFIHQVTNEQRQNRPSIKVSPADDKGDKEIAKVFEGLIRNIQNTSNADVAYDSAFDAAVRMGRGFFRIYTDYVNQMSFDQEIRIGQIANHFAVYLDPSANEPDGSDANWGFIFDEIDKDEFKVQYPEAEISQMADWTSIGDDYLDWIDKNTCRVAEYYCKDFKTVEIFNTIDGVKKENELDEANKQQLRLEKKSRFTLVATVNYYKINGFEILERSEFAAPWIPIIPVYGDRLNINGQWTYESLVRHAIDSQRMYNYWVSAETEAIALAPKAPFIAAEGQIPDEYMRDWTMASRKPISVLTYKPTDLMGVPLPPPQRNTYEPAIGAITNARAGASEDIKATTGIYDASMGNRSNETSGRAINARNIQAQVSNYHYVDNLAYSLRYAGRILVALIPKIYDAARAEKIIGIDGTEEIVLLNQMFVKGGQSQTIDLNMGKYDVVTETGPSFATKRQEAMADLIDFSKMLGPDIAGKISDLVAGQMDSPAAKELQERLRKFLPAGIVEDKDKKPLPPEVQAQLAQMEQMIQQLSEQASKAADIINNKKLELASQEKIAAQNNETKIIIEQMKIEKGMTQAAMEQALELDREQNINESGGDEAALVQQDSTGSQPVMNNEVM